jgi:hypothetical protein
MLRTTSRRWSAISASGSPVALSANASARASTWRDNGFEIQPMPVDTSRIESARAGSTTGPVPGVSRRVISATASMPNGATIAT